MSPQCLHFHFGAKAYFKSVDLQHSLFLFSMTPIPCLHQQFHSFASGPPPELVAQTRGAMQWQTVSELSALGMLDVFIQARLSDGC